MIFIQGENIASYSYENDGLHLLEHGNRSRLVTPLGNELKKWESDFRKPCGGKLKLPFRNIGSTSQESVAINLSKH